MKLALECPIKMMSQVQPLADFDFMLTHLFADYDYRNYYMSSNRFKILDNSTNELGQPCSVSEILSVAEVVLPDFVCPPDYLGNAVKTLEALEEMDSRLVGSCSILPIIQCDMDDHMSVYKFADHLVTNLYNCVAVPYDIMGDKKKSVEELARTRREIIFFLAKKFDWIHLLGVTDPNELLNYKKIPNVRSVDTGAPITNGLAGVRYGRDDPLRKKHMLDFDAPEMVVKQEADVYHNIAYIRSLLAEEDDWLAV